MKVGDTLAALTLPAISGAASTLFAGVSGVDESGLSDSVHAPGIDVSDAAAPAMLWMAYLGRFLTARFDQARLRHFAARFIDIAHAGDEISCTGEVLELFDAGCERHARIEIATTTQFGERIIVGEAIVSL